MTQQMVRLEFPFCAPLKSTFLPLYLRFLARVYDWGHGNRNFTLIKHRGPVNIAEEVLRSLNFPEPRPANRSSPDFNGSKIDFRAFEAVVLRLLDV